MSTATKVRLGYSEKDNDAFEGKGKPSVDDVMSIDGSHNEGNNGDDGDDGGSVHVKGGSDRRKKKMMMKKRRNHHLQMKKGSARIPIF